MKTFGILLFASCLCVATPGRTQFTHNATGAATNPNTATFAAGTQASAFVVACAAWNGSSGLALTVSNDKSDSETLWPKTGAGTAITCAYFQNPSTGSKAYTFQLTGGSVSFLDTFIAEYSGVNNTTQPDVTITTGATSSNAACTTNKVSPTAADQLLVAFAQMATATSVSGGSGTWTLFDTADGNGFADNVNGTNTATQDIVFNSSASGNNDCQIAAFNAASGSQFHGPAPFAIGPGI